MSASLIDIFTAAHQPGHTITADGLLEIFLDGLRLEGRIDPTTTN